MRRFWAGSFVSLCLAHAAYAADQPVQAPPPAWVKPVALPAAPGASGAAVQILLQDQQMNVTAEGLEVYAETATRIQTSQGLAAVGTLQIPWKPSTDTLTIHKVQILRDGRVIDVLAGQSFTVLRREMNLEYAALDGVLTATLQPEDLRVGDILSLAFSIRRVDPVLKGMTDWSLEGPADYPVAHMSLRARWSHDVAMHWQASEALKDMKQARDGDAVEVAMAQDDVQPLVQPAGAPLRFVQLRRAEFSNFPSWGAVSGLMYPLFVKAAVLPDRSPLKAEAARLKAASPDRKAQAAAALALVQDHIRYVFLGLNDGGLVPATADETWSRRFGDCKAKTVLLLALLHELDIPAEAVLVNTQAGDGMDARLPALENFNHVLVRATLDGKAYWLDGTRTGDRGLDDLEIPNFHWGLPLAAKGATLVPVIPKPLDRPASNVDIRIDATAGVHAPAPIHVQSVFTGDAAVGLKLSLANYAPPELERGLRDYWRKQYDFVDVQSVSANYDPGTGAETLVMDGTAHMDWSRRNYETDGTGVGYRADFKRTPGPHDDAPYVTAFPLYTRTAETILLPYDGRGFTISNRADVDSTVAGVRYRRSAGLKGGTFTVETTRRSTVPEFPAADAPAAQQTLRDLAAAAVYVYMPSAYRLTPKDIEVEQARQLTTADDYITRGNDLMTAGDLDHAIADFDRAVALNPKSATALADRGQAFYYKRNFELARRDFDLADAADPRNAVTFRGRGMMALDQADMKGAIAAFTTSLEIDPNNTFALTQRARAYSVLDDYPHALADMETALRIQPDVTQGYAECASLYLEMHDKEKAADEAVKVITANPDLADAHFVSGTIYRMLERNADAFKAFSRSLELKPQPATYLNRARVRPVEDLAGQNADLDAALAMDPKFVPAYRERASLAVKAGDMEGAIAAYTAALDAKPGNADALLQRGLLYAKMGKPDLENADFVAARANVQNPVGLNNMCWVKATMGGDLQSALADCDASLAMEQSQSARSAALDSRGFVLLRLERYDEAIANFDDALKIMPTRYMSRYGRGIAHLRKGEREAGEADIAKVQASDPEAEKEYAKYGVTP